MKNTLAINDTNIQDKTYTICGVQVMLDRGLAKLYGVENWKSQIATTNSDKIGLRKKPFVFIEQGVSIFKVVEFDGFKNLSTLKEYFKYNFLTHLFHLSMKCQRKGLLYE